MSARSTQVAVEPLRIAFVSDTIYPYNKGGKETRLHEISRRLVGEGREVHIYTMKWWDGPKRIIQDGVHLHAISRFYPIYSGERRSIMQALAFGVATTKLLFAKFDVLDVDHMPFYPLFSARAVTWLRRKPLTATWHEVWGRDYWFEYLKGPMGYFGYATEWLSFRLPDQIISNSSHTTARLRAAGVTKPVTTVPLGVDLEAIAAAKPSANMGDVIFVGRLLSHKNADLLIQAVALVKASYPDIRVTIIGDGPEYGRLQALIAELGLARNVSLVGSVKENADVYGLIKSSKMFVLPSVREGFGLVVIEANAMGVPVITVDHKDNAARDLIRPGINGYLAHVTAGDIADKILAVLEQHDKLEPARDIEQYDWRVVTKNIEGALGL